MSPCQTCGGLGTLETESYGFRTKLLKLGCARDKATPHEFVNAILIRLRFSGQ